MTPFVQCDVKKLEVKQMIDTANSAITWTYVATLERALPAWIPASFLFRVRWLQAHDMVEARLRQRHEGGWEPTSELHQLICQISGEECGWTYPCFDLDDDLRVIFWAYYDGLDAEAAFLEVQHRLSVSLSKEEMTTAMYGVLRSLLRC